MTWWAWALAGIACMVIDVHLTHDFSLFCIGVAAFIVAVLAAAPLDLPVWSQCLLFAGLSIAVLLGVRKPLLGRFRPHRGLNADFDYLVGEIATPAGDLAASAIGQAELRGSVWTVRNADSAPLRKGQRCRVMSVEGLTLWIAAE
ncbi:MAG TPA: NfeD family protein [Candidatus Binataceae bacterium]|nr:NfeD family protein [Candidatus Binataceae bacterium]